MASRPFLLSRMSRKERLVIRLIRGAYPAATSPADQRAFDGIRRAASSANLTILPADNLCVSPSELDLLALLAALQRQRPPALKQAHAALRERAGECASRLQHHGVRLDYRLVTRMLDTDPDFTTAAGPTSIIHTKVERPTLLSRYSLQGKALLFVNERGAASTGELNGVGISRQIVNIMFRRGLLRRIRTGVYSAMPNAVAMVR